MQMYNKFKIIAMLLLLTGCAKFNQITCDRCYTPEPKCVYEQHASYVNDADYIVLQNLQSRVVVECYTSKRNPAEYCAQQFEQMGYVRLRDIPYKSANYDFLKTDTYPTRRWRDGETTPRW